MLSLVRESTTFGHELGHRVANKAVEEECVGPRHVGSSKESIKCMHCMKTLMVATTLRIEASQKRRFDELQARIRLMTGRRITQGELLERLLDQAEEAPENIAARQWRPLTKAEIDRVMQLPMDFGFEIGDVDEVLYGKRRRARS